jgi:hypothetical protein
LTDIFEYAISKVGSLTILHGLNEKNLKKREMRKVTKKKITQLILAAVLMFLVLILLMSPMPSHAEGAEEPEVFATYSLESSTQPLYENQPISIKNYPIEEWYEEYIARYIIPIVVAADEEFQNISYWTPMLNYLSWKEAALNIIERADNYLCDEYYVDFVVVGWTTWLSNNNTTYYVDRMHELVNQLNWNPKLKGKTILAGFTGQELKDYYGRSLAGCAFNPRVNDTKAILMSSQGYCWDDNIFHHEISHLFGADDCDSDACVMSYKKTYIGLWYEDGWVFLVCNDVYIAYQTHEYCSDCEWQVFQGPYAIKLSTYGKRSPGRGTLWSCSMISPI